MAGSLRRPALLIAALASALGLQLGEVTMPPRLAALGPPCCAAVQGKPCGHTLYNLLEVA